MDYVKEELLRQKRALEALMLGAAEEEREGEEAPPPTEESSADTAAELLHPRLAAEGSRRTARPAATGAAGRSLRRDAERFAQGAAAERRYSAESALSAVAVQSDARRLSRTIQRDARRYDGGFTIY